MLGLAGTSAFAYAMKLSNPILFLIALVLINALTAVFIFLGAKEQISDTQVKLKIMMLVAFGFLGTAATAYLLANNLIKSFIEPIEICASRMLALEQLERAQASTPYRGLEELTNNLINALETSRQRERLIADYSSDILCCLDAERRFLDLNIQSESVWEYPIISLLATPLDLLICPQDRDDYLKYFESVKDLQAPEKPLECRISARGGKLIDLEWQIEWSPSSKHYYCLARNISDRKENQRLKAEITAMVGHDLRAPASSLSFLLENLKAGTFGELPAEAKEKVERAGDNISQMLKLINQLLDAEKLEGGQMEADLKVIPLSELYENCRSLLLDLAAKRNINIVFPEESTLLSLADFDRSLQILCNLVSNAIKWSPEGGTVLVSEKSENRMIKLSVVDQGPGIAPERQQAVFERFKSMDDRSDKSIASSGLGLYIAKKLTELQGGTICLQSTEGNGCTFSFSLRQASEKDLPPEFAV